MSLLLILLGAVALVLPGLRPTLALKGDPRWFVPLNTLAVTLGLMSIVAGLSLSAAVGGLHLAAGASLARYDGHLALGGIPASLISAAALVTLAGRLACLGWRASRGRRTARAERWLGHHRDLGDHELVILPTATPIAYSVQGSPPQVVISRGLADRLESDLVTFVIDHERAHLSSRHRRALLVAASADALLGRVPAIRCSTVALRLAVERAADEEAAGRDPQRRRRLAIAMGRLGDAQWLPRGATESMQYRAGQLVSPPARTRMRFQVAAAAGLLFLALIMTAVTGHIGGDLPALLAAVW